MMGQNVSQVRLQREHFRARHDTPVALHYRHVAHRAAVHTQWHVVPSGPCLPAPAGAAESPKHYSCHALRGQQIPESGENVVASRHQTISAAFTG